MEVVWISRNQRKSSKHNLDEWICLVQMLASTFLTFHGSDISNDKQVRYLDKDILFNDK